MSNEKNQTMVTFYDFYQYLQSIDRDELGLVELNDPELTPYVYFHIYESRRQVNICSKQTDESFCNIRFEDEGPGRMICQIIPVVHGREIVDVPLEVFEFTADVMEIREAGWDRNIVSIFSPRGILMKEFGIQPYYL